MFVIGFAKDVIGELKSLTAREKSILLPKIKEQLTHEPTKKTKNKKPLPGLKATWEHEEPVWEVRIDEYRVYYDVNVDASRVIIRALRHKPPHLTTEEVL